MLLKEVLNRLKMRHNILSWISVMYSGPRARLCPWEIAERAQFRVVRTEDKRLDKAVFSLPALLFNICPEMLTIVAWDAGRWKYDYLGVKN